MEIEVDKFAKTEARQKMLNSWQNRLEAMREVAQWAKRLIPNIILGIDRKYGEVTYIQAYFYRFKLEDTLECVYCGNFDDAEHTFFQCFRGEEIRTTREVQIEEKVTPDNLLRLMLSSEDHWKLISDTAKKVISQKEKNGLKSRQRS